MPSKKAAGWKDISTPFSITELFKDDFFILKQHRCINILSNVFFHTVYVTDMQVEHQMLIRQKVHSIELLIQKGITWKDRCPVF